MIEREFVAQKLKEFQVREYVESHLGRVGHSHTRIQRTPLGDKVVIHASRPGLIIGRQGENIKNLTKTLKTRFKLENPQVEIIEATNIYLDAQIVAETIANSLERFGANKFKGVGHRVISEVQKAGGLGIEILISGKVPSSRAKTWRLYAGYIKKCGEISISGIRKAYAVAKLKSGAIGIQVKIMPPDLVLPDDIKIYDDSNKEITEEIVTEVVEKPKDSEETTKEEVKENSDVKKTKKKTTTKKKTVKKATKSKSEKKE